MFQLRNALPNTADQTAFIAKNAFEQPGRDVMCCDAMTFHVKHINQIPANNSREDDGGLDKLDQRNGQHLENVPGGPRRSRQARPAKIGLPADSSLNCDCGDGGGKNQQRIGYVSRET